MMMRALLVATAVVLSPSAWAQDFNQFIGGLPQATFPLGTGDQLYLLQNGGSVKLPATTLLPTSGMTVAGLAAANAAALTSANNALGPVFLPNGVYTTNLSEVYPGSTWGLGQWVDGSGNRRAPWHYSITSAPTYTGGGFGSGITTVFNGDFTHVPFATEMFIQGASTVGTPSSGYMQQPPNQIPHYTDWFSNSGHNQSTTSNDGRTGQYVYATNLFFSGAGDASIIGGNIFVNGTATGTGAGGILANPAGVFIGGTIATLTAGNIIQVAQVTLLDNGVDAAGFGWNVTSNRSVSTGANGAWWYGYRSQSIGTAGQVNSAVDVGYQAIGAHKIVLDTSFAVLPVSGDWQQAAATLASGQRIYLNATATDASGYSRFPSSAGSIYADYNGSVIEFVGAGIATPNLPTSAGGGGLFVCVDTSGVQYKKATCP